VASRNVATTRTNVVTLDDTLLDLHVVVTLDNVLDRDDGVGSCRDDTAGGDRHRLAFLERAWLRHTGRDPRHYGQPSRRVLRSHRETVHRRARKGRQIDGREGILGQHAARRSRQLHVLGLERRHPLENALQRLLEREQVSHSAPSV